MFNSDPTNKINNVVKAIAYAEGCIMRDESYNTNSLAYKHNNPCDLKHAPDGYHAMSDGSAHGILMFKSLGDGWNAGYRQVELIVTGKSEVYNPHMTFTEIAKKYAMENNTPKEESIAEGWASHVESFLGISPDTSIGNYVNGTPNPVKITKPVPQPEPMKSANPTQPGATAVIKPPVGVNTPAQPQPQVQLKPASTTTTQGSNVNTTTKITPSVQVPTPTKETKDVK